MKTKLQFIALASLAVMGAGCLAITTGIIANEKEELSINAVQLEEKDTSYDFLTPGNAIYLTVSSSSDWCKNGSNFAFYFFANNPHEESWTGTLTKINYDYSFGNPDAYATYQTVVPEIPNNSSTRWQGAIAVKLTGTEPGWNEKKAYQTENLVSGLTTVNHFVVINSGDYIKCNWETLKHEDRIATWGSTVNWWGANSVCDPDGVNTNLEQLEAGWAESAETFNALGYDVRAYFSNVQAMDEADSQAHNCNKLAAKYDYLVRKYGLTDFAQRL